MKLNKLFLLLLPLSLVACSNNTPEEPEKPDPTLLTTPLCMTCTSDAVDGLLNVIHFAADSGDDFSLQYSRDNKTWHDVEFTYKQSTFFLKKDETIYFRGNNPKGFNLADVDDDGDLIPQRLTMFAAISGAVSIGGNIMSLLASTEFDKLTEIPCDWCFAELFNNYESYSLYTDASKLSLPATKLKKSCYMRMFMQNELLETAPILPATTLVENCYMGMFSKCRSLKRLQVAFDETAFDIGYLYTKEWLLRSNEEINALNDEKPIFIWPGDIDGIDRNENTVPTYWEIQKK